MRNSREWKRGKSKEITFIVTKDCQLACSYCYQVGKNSSERLPWDIAKRFIDYILSSDIDFLMETDSVIFTFIGGEPFLEIDLIDRICDYLKMQMYLRGHRWFNSYRFAITTNGINYDTPKVQQFIKKNISHLSLTITIDGTQKKHDLNRIWKTASKQQPRGSYSDVVRNIPLWLKQFPNAATKVTISSADIPYICESVLHLYSLGILNVYINCVFENVWHEGDDLILHDQLRKLADEIIDRRLYKTHMCSFFERWIGKPIDKEEDTNWCGAGRMLAIDKNGLIYPCIRFAGYSLRDKAPRTIGDIDNGIDIDLLRPYYSLSRSLQSSRDCMECDVASGCAWCQAENYDTSEGQGTIFHRATAICKMHKARVRANEYYWKRIDEIEGTAPDATRQVDNTCTIDKTVEAPETLIVLLSSDSAAFCISDNPSNDHHTMPLSVLKKIVEKAEKEHLDLWFVFPDYDLPEEYMKVIDSRPHMSIANARAAVSADAVVLNGWADDEAEKYQDKFCILRTTFDYFHNKAELLWNLLHHVSRLNIVFTDEKSFSEDDGKKYDSVLQKLSTMVFDQWKSGHRVNVNILTDRLQLTAMDNCNAGWKSVTIAPNGKYYICPDFYYAGETDSCGDIDNGVAIANPLMYKLNHAPLCRDCGAYHCSRCVFLSHKKTLEANIPSQRQCAKAEIEMKASRLFYDLWKRDMSV